MHDETKLPGWARALIDQLRFRLQTAREELTVEVAQLRIKCRRLEDRYNALLDIVQAAGRGGNETAQAYVARMVEENSREEG